LKYKAKAFWYNLQTGEKVEGKLTLDSLERFKWFYFASMYEWKIFEAILTRFTLDNISKDHPLLLFANRYTSMAYRPDFKLWDDSFQLPLLVEAKGFFTPVAKLKLKLLTELPEWDNRLVIVSESKVSSSLTKLPYHFLNLEQFTEWIKDYEQTM